MSAIAIDPAVMPAAVVGPAPAPGASATPASAPVSADRLYRMSLDQYHRLAEAGILGDARVELIEGVLVAKMSKGQPHIIALALLIEALRAVPAGWFLAVQDPITLEGSASEPEPDAKVIRGRPRDYAGRRIGPADTTLIVEIADSSLRDDQGVKKAIYAQAAVPAYWIVNIAANRLEVYTDPTGVDPSPDYRRRADLAPGDEVPLVVDGREVARIAVADLLP